MSKPVIAEPNNSRKRPSDIFNDRTCWLISTLVFTVPLLFSLYTNHVWEDYYITFRASKNLAQGHGLVYQLGEHVHSFTSPLGVLLPALLSYTTRSDQITLWCFRLICCAALAGTSLILWRTLENQGASRRFCWFATAMLLAESKVLDFTINGMEAPFMLLFCAALLKHLVENREPKPLVVGSLLAALMWTRPDAFVFAGAIITSVLLFTSKSWRNLKRALAMLAIAAFWAGLLYGPWFIWAWWYYGSPVPNTIVAKSGGIHHDLGISFLWKAPFDYVTGKSTMEWLLSPSYYFLGGWPQWMIRILGVLSIIAGMLWLARPLPLLVRICSLVLFLGSYYLQAIPPAPWYFPAWYLFAAISLGGGAAWLVDRSHSNRAIASIVRCAVLGVFIVQAATVPLVAIQVKHQQELVEEGGRRKIGEWLAKNAPPTDTVFLEPLGYIGYYSQLHMMDYPGLCAPVVVQARRQVGNSYEAVIKKIHPTWLVLRGRVPRSDPSKPIRYLDDYEFVRAWDASASLDSIAFLPGRGLLEFDATFLVFRRMPKIP